MAVCEVGPLQGPTGNEDPWALPTLLNFTPAACGPGRYRSQSDFTDGRHSLAGALARRSGRAQLRCGPGALPDGRASAPQFASLSIWERVGMRAYCRVDLNLIFLSLNATCRPRSTK